MLAKYHYVYNISRQCVVVNNFTGHPLNSATPELLQLLQLLLFATPELLRVFFRLLVKSLFAAGATEIERSAFVFRLIG
jgi:hypothetical protein